MDNVFNIEQKYFPALSKIFSPIVVDKLLSKRYSPYLSEVLVNSGLKSKLDFSISLELFFNSIYNQLINNYPNEYIFKTLLIQEILLSNHSPQSSQILLEFRVEKSKADLILLNGTATVYEIKTQYDSLYRLEQQINSYSLVFDHIYVISTLKYLDKILSTVDKKVGVITLDIQNQRFEKIRDAKSNLQNIKLDVLFDSLRQCEYQKIIANYFGSIPDIPNTQIYSYCKKKYCDIPLLDAYEATISLLKKRGNSLPLQNFLAETPIPLWTYLLSNNNIEKVHLLERILDTRLSEFISPIN